MSPNKKNNTKSIFRVSLSILLISLMIQIMFFNFSTFNNVSASSSWTSISDTDFNNGTFDNVTIVGNGESAELKLKQCEWLEKTPLNEPGGRYNHGMVSIYGDDKVLIFGGVENGDNIINDTWIYDQSENKWVQKIDGPNVRYEFAMASVYETDNVVLFGGNYNGCKDETWIYDLSDDKWVNKTSTGNKPSGRERHAMATIWSSKKVLLFGGRDSNHLNDTWLYDLSDNTWTIKNPSNSQSIRSDHGMAPIWGTDKVLLFSGSWGEPVGDTWIYDLSDNTWIKIIPNNQVSYRYRYAIASIWGTDKVVIFGGGYSYGDKQYSETWIYDLSDNTWIEKKLSYYPDERWQHRMAFINKTNKVILFGGTSDITTYSSDTWEFENIDHGIFISNPYDIGPNASYKTINWNSDSMNETSIKLQLRTAASESEINLKPFIGPNGKSSSYYITSGELIFSGHRGERMVQYKIHFNSTVEDEIPDLGSVTINFNYWPECPILINPYNGSKSNNNIPTFTWIFKDVDSTHQSAFELLISNDRAFGHFNYTSGVQISTNQFWQFSTGVNYTVIPDGPWYWRVRTKDNDGDWGPFSSVSKFVIDSKAPSSRIIIPDNNGFYKTLNTISGKALDSIGSEIYKVEIVIQRLSDYHYWDGLEWNSNEHWLPVTGENSWTYDSSNITWITDIRYNIRSRATDNSNNHEIPGFGNTFMIDNKSPSPISILINNNQVYTNSTLANLSLLAKDSGSGIDQMAFSTDESLWTNWELFNHQKSITLLSNDGKKTVYFKVQDRAGNFAIANNSIILDKRPPENLKVMINNGAKFTNSRLIDLDLYATDSLSGIRDMVLDTKVTTIISWEAFKESNSMILPPGDGVKNIYFRVRDNAENIALTYTTIILDTIPPHSLSIEINNGSSVTSLVRVNLNINAFDDTSGIYQMSFSNEGITWSSWEVYQKNKSFVLPSGDGVKTIYFKVMDYANNTAEPVFTTILLNATSTEIDETLNEDELDKDESSSPRFSSIAIFWLFLIIIIIIIVILIVLQIIMKRKKQLELSPATQVTIRPPVKATQVITNLQTTSRTSPTQQPMPTTVNTSLPMQQPKTTLTTQIPTTQLPQQSTQEQLMLPPPPQSGPPQQQELQSSQDLFNPQPQPPSAPQLQPQIQSHPTIATQFQQQPQPQMSQQNQQPLNQQSPKRKEADLEGWNI